MQIEFLSPGVQDRKEADLGLQTLPSRNDFGECFRSGPEQQVIDHSIVLKCQSAQFAGQSEDDMEVLHRQQLSLPILEPLSTCPAFEIKMRV